jgi:hypothetical protein
VTIGSAVAMAISGDRSQTTLNARKSICMCSCAADIISVYSGIFLQWSLLNPSISSKISILQSMCASDYKRTVSAKVSESSPVQCANNNISILLNASDTVPHGSVITITGLNAKASLGGLQIQALPQSLISSFQWIEATCRSYCPPSRLCRGLSSCNSTGSGWQAGVQKNSRCSPWCDSDSVLQLTTNGTFVSTVISLMLENGCLPNQPIPNITVSINGPSFLVPPTAVVQTEQVLTFQSPPGLSVVSVSEDSQDVFDVVAGIWRGNAFGQRNTVRFEVQPNVEVYAGANITITGLISSAIPSQSAPTVRQSPTMVTSMIVNSWTANTGRIVLSLTNFNSSAIMIAGSTYVFGLEIDMPQDSSNALAQSPNLTFEASGLGPRRACCCIATKQNIPTRILVPQQSLRPFFPMQSIGQSICSPGECNTITITIAINRAVANPKDNMYIQISGLLGMDADPQCSPACDKISSRLPLQDVLPGLMNIVV